jgi:hypothetical protein
MYHITKVTTAPLAMYSFPSYCFLCFTSSAPSCSASSPGLQDGRKLAALPFAFNVSWSLGGASPANMAGMFLLSEPGKTFSLKPVAPRGKSLQGSNVTALPMVKLTIQGFLPAAGTAAGAVIVRGDWGQPAPPAGVPGPQVSIKQGAPQKVQLIAKITTA